MNTTKQVNVMIGLLFMAFLVFSAYFITEGSREAAARSSQDELMAHRGATIYVNNCRTCHGMNGLGQEEGGVGPALNNVAFLVLGEDNAFNLPPTAAGDARSIHDFLFNTIACGRSNTAMPVWAERYGGPLSDTQIGYVATLIKQARWDLVEKVAEEVDGPLQASHAEAYSRYKKAYDDPSLTKEQKKAVDEAITKKTATSYHDLSDAARQQVDDWIKKSVLVADPAKLSVTGKNCGQYGAAVLDFRSRNPLSADGTNAAAAGGGGTDPVSLGKRAATQYGCTACHSVDGKVGVGPSWKGIAGADIELADGKKVKGDDAFLKESITAPNATVVKGFQPNVMPATYQSQLKPEEIDNIIAYIKSLK